ncbi:hypothetical protein EYF80_061603 [Liparis tanakae]|uniref:Uncharacterized protein n=1 Tax=Liparis tanakae TaxID=230148 RepID=A0A4Z2EHE6_9TELE|nr:hypothetical protein EYF80_061603 [Liparis tanakae]
MERRRRMEETMERWSSSRWRRVERWRWCSWRRIRKRPLKQPER